MVTGKISCCLPAFTEFLNPLLWTFNVYSVLGESVGLGFNHYGTIIRKFVSKVQKDFFN